MNYILCCTEIVSDCNEELNGVTSSNFNRHLISSIEYEIDVTYTTPFNPFNGKFIGWENKYLNNVPCEQRKREQANAMKKRGTCR